MKAGSVDDTVGEFYGNQHTGSTYDNYSYENLVEDISELASELGHPPTTAEAAEDERLPSIATMYDIIGEDWANVLVDAGLEPGALQYSEYGPSARNEMLMDLRRCCKRTTGETLTTRAYEGVGAYSKDTIKKYFGTWSAACERAGISPGTRHGDDSEGPQRE